MPRRPTLVDIAKKAGVSVMTVSYALRNQPQTAASTREHVMKVARELGYVPDPEISRMMNYLRANKGVRYQSTLALLNSHPTRAAFHYPFMDRLVRGAADRAKELGYSLEEFWISEPGITPSRMKRILHARGVRGLLVPPLPDGRTTLDIDWGPFASIAMTSTLETPSMTRVAADTFSDKTRLLEYLHGLGYRRMAMVTNPDQERREHSGSTSAFHWYHREVLRQDQYIPPLHLVAPDRSLLTWLRREKPDVLIGPDERLLKFLREQEWAIPGKLGYAAFAGTVPGVTGIDPQPERIGAAAIDSLSAQIQRNEHGIPQNPKVILIEGELVEGSTTRLIRSSKLRGRSRTV